MCIRDRWQEYSLAISEEKTKMKAFKGKYPVKTKIIRTSSTLEQVSNFKHLRYEDRSLNLIQKTRYISLGITVEQFIETLNIKQDTIKN